MEAVSRELEEIASQVIKEIMAGYGLGPAKAAKLLPALRDNEDDHPSTKTLIRYMRVGVLDQFGRRVKLEAACISNRWLTSKQAVERFLAALTSTDQTTQGPTQAVQSKAVRRKACEAAAKRLADAGA